MRGIIKVLNALPINTVERLLRVLNKEIIIEDGKINGITQKGMF